MPPPRPLFVTEIIPATIQTLQERHQRILAITGAGGFVTDPELQRVLDLCKQILEPPQQ
ncbi:hypothetical protein SAMN05216188_11867 [Lentzea xinjiangensis]|uniref:Uncharacterized protein n=1 Tax=Lentzea xinjiangensis TaxID=402600 RepID=A0A1H9TFV0_9PSEU|nr:hypothetical protein [Lentzea xinjiangensis]SER95483.1 hypothetical protein SAMN05216188_11867 [Lentzea xinjiangensis]